jgi:hypothetical protein
MNRAGPPPATSCAAFQWMSMVSRDTVLEENDPLVRGRSQVLERYEANLRQSGP